MVWKRRRQRGFVSMMIVLPTPLPRKTNPISVAKLKLSVLNLANNKLPATAINTYKKVNSTARILTLRLLLREVNIIKIGADRITAKAIN